MKRYKKITRTPGEWVLDIVKVVFLAFVVVVTVYPFWNIFIISINDATDAIRGGLYFLPRKLSLSSYAEILGRSTFLASIKVSVGRTLIGTPIAVLVTAMLDIGTMMMELAALSFLGLGAKPPTAEWGSMMSDTRSLMTTSPWITFSPGIAIFISVMVFNLLGDTIRDYADPKSRGR